MGRSENELDMIPAQELVTMMDETSHLVSVYNTTQLSSMALAAQSSNALTDNVEFWKWMGRNYRRSGIFDSTSSMQRYIARGEGKEAWFSKQLQGKGYEWDWMSAQRGSPKNILNAYDAGDVVNRAASDVTERSLLTGKSKEYQMKAYTSRKNPDLKTTPKDMTVVTNAEKAGVVRRNGYQDVQEFQDAGKIKQATKKRLDDVKSGRAQTAYTFQNVAGTMAKAGLVGCAIGMGVETIASYRSWKQGSLTDTEYLAEILKSGGDAGFTAGATAGIMIPVSATITAAGLTSFLTIPVAFVVSAAVNQVVAPCFARGQYREILSKARYYQSVDAVYGDLLTNMQTALEEYYAFVRYMAQQREIHQTMRGKSEELSGDLKALLDSI